MLASPLMIGRAAVERGLLGWSTHANRFGKNTHQNVRPRQEDAGKQGTAGNALLLSSEKQESKTKTEFKPQPLNLNFTSSVSGDSRIILFYFNTITDLEITHKDNWENTDVPTAAKVHTKVAMSYYRRESFLSSAGMSNENKAWQTLQRRYAVSETPMTQQVEKEQGNCNTTSPLTRKP